MNWYNFISRTTGVIIFSCGILLLGYVLVIGYINDFQIFNKTIAFLILALALLFSSFGILLIRKTKKKQKNADILDDSLD